MLMVAASSSTHASSGHDDDGHCLLFEGNRPVPDAADNVPDWMAQNLIPLNRLTLIFGESEAGKSYLCAFLVTRAASGTLGEAFGGLPTPPINVVWCSAEETRKDVKSRLVANDVDRVGGNIAYREPFGILSDEALAHRLREIVARDRASLLILDSLNALGEWERGALYDAGVVGRVLSTLDSVARRCRCTILLIHHPNLSTGHRPAGSAVLRQYARVVVKVERKREAPTSMVILDKCSIGTVKKGPRATFELEPAGDAYRLKLSLVSLAAERATVNDAPKLQRARLARNLTKTERAAEWLVEVLAGKSDGLLVSELKKLAAAARMKWGTVEHARITLLGVVHTSGNRRSGYRWALVDGSENGSESEASRKLASAA